MSLFEQFREQFVEAGLSGETLIPPGDYYAVFMDYSEDEERRVIRLRFGLQGNPGLQLDTGEPVDGLTVEMPVWLPKPEDYHTPSGSPRGGTKASVKLRMAARTWKALGYNPDEHEDLSAVLGAVVRITIQHEQYDGENRERVRWVRAVN